MCFQFLVLKSSRDLIAQWARALALPASQARAASTRARASDAAWFAATTPWARRHNVLRSRIRRLRVLLKTLMLLAPANLSRVSQPFLPYIRGAHVILSVSLPRASMLRRALQIWLQANIDANITRRNPCPDGFLAFYAAASYRYVKPDIYTLCSLPSRQKLRVFLNLHHCAALWCVSPLNS